MIKLSNGVETIQVSEIDIYGEFVYLSWGQYMRIMTLDEFEHYSIIE